MATWTKNPYAAGKTAGTEVSPIDHGLAITVLESLLTHPTHADGFVDKGDPVVFNSLVGVAKVGAAAATDYVAVATGGIWNLTVVEDETANHAIGEPVYITSAGVLETDASGNTLFGYLMAALLSGVTGVRPVAVSRLV